MSEKDARAAAFCSARGADGLILRRRGNIAWISDGRDVHCDLHADRGVASVVWTPERKVVRTDAIEAARLRDEEFDASWRVESRPWADPEPADPPGRFITDWPADALTDLRSPVTQAEIARARDLGRDAGAVFASVMPGLRPGLTEHEVAGRLAGGLRERGLFARVLLVAADERVALYRHPIPTGRRVDRLVMAAVCAERRGLIVSLTRVVHFGPVPAELRRRHDAVCSVDAALHAATRPGVRWCDAFAAGVRVYRDAGFDGHWLKHHQGGPMGYECRDFKASPSETRAVAAAQLVGWNPTIDGTKSEDTILVTAAGAEVLTPTDGWPVNDRAPGRRPDILEA